MQKPTKWDVNSLCSSFGAEHAIQLSIAQGEVYDPTAFKGKLTRDSVEHHIYLYLLAH